MTEHPHDVDPHDLQISFGMYGLCKQLKGKKVRIQVGRSVLRGTLTNVDFAFAYMDSGMTGKRTAIRLAKVASIEEL